MAGKQSLKQGEKILFGIVVAFIIMAALSYAALEAVRLNSDKPIFASKTHFTLSEEGRRGSEIFRKSRCTSCHRAMRNGTNMGLSLDGVGSLRSQQWLYSFLRDPEKTYGAPTVDHGQAPKEAAYVMYLPKEDLHALSVFISELKSDQGSASAPVPPEGRSEFIDSMVGSFAPQQWQEKYTDVREKQSSDTDEQSSKGVTGE